MNPCLRRSSARGRRIILPLLTFVLVIGLLMPALAGNRAAAEDATPVASVLANLGYPELRLVVTDEGPEAPTEASAGRHLIVLENHGSPDGPAALSDVNLLRLPEGVTLDDLNALLASSAGTVPDWFHQIDSAGGFYVAAGGTGYAVLDLEAGEWYIGIGDSNPYSLLTVTDAPIASPIPAIDPPADLEIEMVEFELGLPATLPAGQQVWHATNAGSQQHEMVLVRTPVEMTVESVITVLTLPEGEPVPAGLPDPSTIEFLTEGLKTMSPGREIWIELDLSPGNYAAYCGSPDIERGQPHALIGEAHVFTVQ